LNKIRETPKKCSNLFVTTFSL